MKRWFSLLLACLLLCGCTGEKAVSSEQPMPASLPPLLDVAIPSLLTAAQISETVQAKMEPPLIYEEGLWAEYTSADYAVTVNIHLEKLSRASYDETMATMREILPDEGLEAAPNLGDTALWNPQERELWCYARGYMVGISVLFTKRNVSDSLLCARQLTALLIENL